MKQRNLMFVRAFYCVAAVVLAALCTGCGSTRIANAASASVAISKLSLSKDGTKLHGELGAAFVTGESAYVCTHQLTDSEGTVPNYGEIVLDGTLHKYRLEKLRGLWAKIKLDPPPPHALNREVQVDLDAPLGEGECVYILNPVPADVKTTQTPKVTRGRVVMVNGLPEEYQGSVAFLPDSQADVPKPGQSGSPVFVLRNGRPVYIGPIDGAVAPNEHAPWLAMVARGRGH